MRTVKSLIQIDCDKFYAPHLPGGLISERFNLNPSKPFFSLISSVRKYFILYYTEHWFLTQSVVFTMLLYVKRKWTLSSCTLMECKRFPRNCLRTVKILFSLRSTTDRYRIYVSLLSFLATPAPKTCPLSNSKGF